MTDKPKPGTTEAWDLGCCCPRIDNHYGAGWHGDGKRCGWAVNGNCKVHDESDARATDDVD